ncbi:MAG TPA: low molecular weight protein-tyrosine-phosphatase [Actinomycetota bacterium]|nr:low molecular weight protein-tyrosine-phosphatase [Actinomycetota bacterium]
MSLHVCFVCSGNICRSPMAEMVFREHLRREALQDRVKVTSAGTGGWHVGDGADYRAAAVLAEHGYPYKHTAAQVNTDHLKADLLVALDRGHHRALERLVERVGGDPHRIVMLRSFDPNARGDLEVPDPYYGGDSGFTRVLSMIEACMPGLLEWVRTNLDRQDANSKTPG